MDKSQTEREIELAVDLFRMALQAKCGENIETYIQVRGVTMDSLVQTDKEIKNAVNCGFHNDRSNFYVNLDFEGAHITLNTLNEY